jgi:hypothetical protein
MIIAGVIGVVLLVLVPAKTKATDRVGLERG